MRSISILPPLLEQYESGFSLAQPFYIHPKIFEEEWEAIFKKQWIYAGNLAQIKKAGDYFLYEFGNEAIILIRGNNGEVFAHYNTCTHRGSVICSQPTGNATKLICPYHQWVFNTNGVLEKARMMPTSFCKHEYNLHSLPVQVLEGLIFICISDRPPDFSPIANALKSYLAPFNLAVAQVAERKHYRLAANWKLVAENFRECYHCGGGHPEYCKAVIGASLTEDTEELLAQKQQDWAQRQLETRLVTVTTGTTSYAVRYPLRPGFESYSTDGLKVSIPMGTHIDHDAGVVGLVNYPNFWMDAVSDYVWTMRVTPISECITDVEFCWLVAENAQEGRDYQLKHLTDFWEITGAQDAQLCENNFKGIRSSAYQPGPYAPVEDQVVNFVDWYILQLKQAMV